MDVIERASVARICQKSAFATVCVRCYRRTQMNSHLVRSKVLSLLWKLIPQGLKVWLIQRLVPTFLVGVSGVILNEKSQVLLVRHVFRNYDRWALPGGWLQPGEIPSMGLERELQEELGMTIKPISCIRVQTETNPNQIQFVFKCNTSLALPSTIASLELAEARFFSRSELSNIAMLENERQSIERCLNAKVDTLIDAW